MFDLIFYPNVGRMYGQAQFYDKLVCRNADFTKLCAIIIKTIDDYAATNGSFSTILKIHTSELTLAEALANMSTEIPAHSSTDANGC